VVCLCAFPVKLSAGAGAKSQLHQKFIPPDVNLQVMFASVVHCTELASFTDILQYNVTLAMCGYQ